MRIQALCYMEYTHVAKTGNTFKCLGGILKGYGGCVSQRCGWEDSIKIHVKETECEYMDWTCEARDRDKWLVLLNVELKLLVLFTKGNLFTS